MALSLSRGETILFPMPYVEAERPPYVVTNQRLVEQHERGERVLLVKHLIAANRAKSRPYAAIGAFLLCLSVAVLGTGAYFTWSVWGMQAAPYKALLPKSDGEAEEPEEEEQKAAPKKVEPAPPPPEEMPEDPDAERPDDAAWRLNILKTRILGMGLLGLGFLIGTGGLRVFSRRRYFVVCRTADSIMRIRVNDKIQQDIILATLQAVK